MKYNFNILKLFLKLKIWIFNKNTNRYYEFEEMQFKVIVLIFILSFLGILLFLSGLFINIRFRSFKKCLAFYLLAFICIVPG